MSTNLVPAKLQHEDFWTRYFFAISEFEVRHEQLDEMLARHDQFQSSWDTDDDSKPHSPDELDRAGQISEHPSIDSELAVSELPITGVESNQEEGLSEAIGADSLSAGSIVLISEPSQTESDWKEWD